jgi:hypothetical protein
MHSGADPARQATIRMVRRLVWRAAFVRDVAEDLGSDELRNWIKARYSSTRAKLCNQCQ